jgi:hypothetical protein
MEMTKDRLLAILGLLNLFSFVKESYLKTPNMYSSLEGLCLLVLPSHEEVSTSGDWVVESDTSRLWSS